VDLRLGAHCVALTIVCTIASTTACGDSTSGQGGTGATGGGAGSGDATGGGAGSGNATGGGGSSGSASGGGVGSAGVTGSAGADAGGRSGSGGNSGSAGAAGNGGSAGGAGQDGASGSGGRSDAGASPGCGLPVTPGQTKQTLDVGGVARTYLIVVPASVDGRTPAPVILGFHGGNGTSEAAASQYGLTGPERALYVYPQALEFPGAGGVAWNVSRDGNDDEFFDALLVDLGQKHCVDTTRIFAAGQSNGAFFVNQLGCYRPSALRAIAPVAGGGPSSTRECSQRVAAMMVHGTADQTVRIEQGVFSRTFWLAANGCAGASSAPTQPAPCAAYTGCAKPVLWCEHGGGHPWPSFAGPAIRSFFLSF
jgi:polyhydroxybutyrate depolymerase